MIFLPAKLPFRIWHLYLADRFLKGIGLKNSVFARKRFCLLDAPLPIDPKTVYFDNADGVRVDCDQLAILREFINRFPVGTYRYVWVHEKNTSLPQDVLDNPDMVFVRPTSFQNQIELRRANYIVQFGKLPSDFAAHSEQIILHTGFGVPIEKRGADHFQKLVQLYDSHRSLNVSDIILSSGEYHAAQAIYSNHAPINRDAIYPVGFPRRDILAGVPSRRTLCETAKPILLYAPAVTTAELGTDAHIKACQMLAHELSDDYDIYADFGDLTSEKIDLVQHGAKPVPLGENTTSFLANVAILVTDYSSIALDFLILDRPVILHAHNVSEHCGESVLDQLPFTVVRQSQELVSAIRAAVKPSKFTNFTMARDRFLGPQEQTAAESAVDLMLNFKREPIQSTKHRVLLFGGSFQQNGMTTSLINLTKMIDYDRIELFIVVSPSILDSHPAQRELFDRLDPRVHILMWTPGKLPKSDRKWLSRKRHTGKKEKQDSIVAGLLERFKVDAKRHWRDIAFDATVVFTGYSAPTGLLALSANVGHKAIFLHNDIAAEIESKGRISWIVPYMYRRFDKVASVSPALMDINGTKLRSYIPTEVETFCRNTLDHVEMRRRANVACPIADEMRGFRRKELGAKLYIHAGRFSEEKNHRLLLEAFQELLHHSPGSHLWLVGNGRLFEEIVAYSKALDLSENVHFTGWMDNPAPAMKEADAFVLSSIYEGQPMVLLEAMTLGTRCVAVDSPQVRYVLSGDLGLVTAPTKEGLAEGMIKVTSETFAPLAFDPVAYNELALNDFYDVIGLPK